MGRLIAILAIIMIVSNVSFAATEKETKEKRIETLQRELKRENISLAKFKEELIFLNTSGNTTIDQIDELEENISATKENIKFLEAELQSAKGERPQLVKKNKQPPAQAEAASNDADRKWWDVYSRSKSIQ